MCVQASRLWWLFQVLALRTTTRLKRENPWLESLGMIYLGELGIWPVVLKRIADGIQILARRCGPRRRSLLLPRLDGWTLNFSITPKLQTLFLCVVARSSSDLHIKCADFSKTLLWLKQTQAVSDALRQHWHRQGSLLQLWFGLMQPMHQVHNGCKISLMYEGGPVRSITWPMATNYILLYFGQPMHAFNLILLSERSVRVACWWKIGNLRWGRTRVVWVTPWLQ